MSRRRRKRYWPSIATLPLRVVAFGVIVACWSMGAILRLSASALGRSRVTLRTIEQKFETNRHRSATERPLE